MQNEWRLEAAQMGDKLITSLDGVRYRMEEKAQRQQNTQQGPLSTHKISSVWEVTLMLFHAMETAASQKSKIMP